MFRHGCGYLQGGKCKETNKCLEYGFFARKLKNRWEDDVKSDITRMKITNWKDCIRNRTKWKKLVEMAKTSLKL